MPTQKSAAQFFCDFPRAILVPVSLGDAFSLRFVAPSRAPRHSCARLVIPARRLVTPARRSVIPARRLVTPVRRFVTYRSSSGKFTVRRAVSDKSAEKSEEA